MYQYVIYEYNNGCREHNYCVTSTIYALKFHFNSVSYKDPNFNTSIAKYFI